MMMDWEAGIERHRGDLLRIVAALALMIGSGSFVARHVYLAVLAVLRPAESAARRLIAVAARGIVVEPKAARAAPGQPIPKGTGEHVPSFPLFDRRKRVGPVAQKVPGHGPNIRHFDGLDAPIPEWRKPMADDPVDIAQIMRRMAALRHALNTIDAQAKRLARALAKRERPVRPMRPGRPPGHMEKGKREIDEILADCHLMALWAMDTPVNDTS